MARATTRAAPKRHHTMPSPDPPPAAAVPTTTGTTAAGRVRGRAPSTQRLVTSWPPRERAEVGRALVPEGVASVLRLLRSVEEEIGVVGQLLDAGHAVLLGV